MKQLEVPYKIIRKLESLQLESLHSTLSRRKTSILYFLTGSNSPTPPLRYVVPMQHPVLWGGGFYSIPSCCSSPVVNPAPCHHPNSFQHRPPNSRPSRNRRRKKGSRKAEPQNLYQLLHESMGTVFCDRSTGINRCHGPIDARNNPRIGKVWRTPPKNPFSMADCNLT